MESAYTIPNGERVYAIGDVHGCLAALDALHARIYADIESSDPVRHIHIVYMGDYVDRGPDSAGVIRRLIEQRAKKDGIRRHFLKGNHEAAMLAFMREPLFVKWLPYGGIEALESYGVDTGSREILLPAEIESLAAALERVLPKDHRHFLERLETRVTIGDYLFVHAGIRPGVPLKAQVETDLIEIREPFLSWEEPHEKRVVYGHSAYDRPFVRPNRIGIDTRCVFGGNLTCLVAEARDIRFLSVSKSGESTEAP